MAENLAGRVRDRATANGGRPAAPGTAVAKTTDKTLRQQIEDMLPQFDMAMPKGFEAQQLIRDAMTLMQHQPKLAECTPQSVLGGLMTFAQLGLRPGVMGQGWLLPFKTRAPLLDDQGRKRRDGSGREIWVDVYQAQIVIGYQGYVELVARSGSARKTTGRAVHANDHIVVEYGLNETLEHRPPRPGEARGEVTGYYSVIFLTGADPLFWYMTRDEAIEWRNKYAMSVKRKKVNGKLVPDLDDDGNVQGSGPWFEMDGPAGGTGFDQQAIKTCYLRAKRFAPKSTDRLLNAAETVDGAVRLAFRPAGPDDVSEMENAVHIGPDDVVIDMEEDAVAGGAPAGDAPAAAPSQGAAKQGQLTGISAMLTRAGITDRAEVLQVISHIVGATIPSRKELTYEQAAQVLTTLGDWQRGDLAAECRAVLGQAPAATGAADNPGSQQATVDPAKLPKAGTRTFHAARHPVLTEGVVVFADEDKTGECGYCDGPPAGDA